MKKILKNFSKKAKVFPKSADNNIVRQNGVDCGGFPSMREVVGYIKKLLKVNLLDFLLLCNPSIEQIGKLWYHKLK